MVGILEKIKCAFQNVIAVNGSVSSRCCCPHRACGRYRLQVRIRWMCDPTTCIRTLIGSSSFTVRAWWCEDRRNDPVRVEARFIRLEILDCQVHVQEGAQTRNMHAHTCLCSQLLLGQLRHVAELNDCWDNGKAKLSFFEDMWDKTLRNLPPDFIPMWGQMEDSGDRCGSTFTPHFSRVADNRPPGQ